MAPSGEGRGDPPDDRNTHLDHQGHYNANEPEPHGENVPRSFTSPQETMGMHYAYHYFGGPNYNPIPIPLGSTYGHLIPDTRTGTAAINHQPHELSTAEELAKDSAEIASWPAKPEPAPGSQHEEDRNAYYKAEETRSQIFSARNREHMGEATIDDYCKIYGHIPTASYGNTICKTCARRWDDGKNDWVK
ncbi:hypothetical protein BJ508DRAFT_326423 [Ascobolus immersus RN42]|uniref:Uncharacterized protein n=1 Tax=Ascobolus immersus RN42 TaxID=1160509 RepID=A0A3N4IA16_ASCIM|nr:hypothetical protein BJ508DRAFT_326423 [Ascobolus immersus RN42]